MTTPRTVVLLPDNSPIAVPIISLPHPVEGGGDTTAIYSPARQASAALSALRVVTTNGEGQWIYADSSTLAHATAAIALLDSAILSGATGDGIFYGSLTDSSWNWDIELPIFLSSSGTLTQSPPVSGFVRIVAQPITATALVFNPQLLYIYG